MKILKISLKTLAGSLRSNYIGIFHHSNQEVLSLAQVRWHYIASHLQFEERTFKSLVQNPIILSYCEKLPEDMYVQFSKHSHDKNSTQESKLKFGSVLLVPILMGADRYGTMLINDPNPDRKYTSREIQLALSVGIIISLALKNYANQNYLIKMYKALSQFHVGVYIMEISSNIPDQIIFLNSYIKELMGTNIEVPRVFNFTDFFAPEDIPYLYAIDIARSKGQKLPSGYFINFKAPNGFKRVAVFNFRSQIDGKVVHFGFVYELEILKLKTVQEIVNDYHLELNN